MTKRLPVLNYRQKALVGLLRAFGGRLPNMDFQKYLFLFVQEFQSEPSFEFVPYRFGCFSFQCYADKRRLVEVGMLHESDDWRLKEDVGQADLSLGDDHYTRFQKKYGHLNGEKLVQDIYRRYPYYAIKSEIAARLMNANEQAAIEKARPANPRAGFFTIGYEGSSFEGYLNRLIKHNVKTLVDVRRNPLSRKYGFSKKTLSDTVTKLGIEYVHIPELGIDSEQRQDLKTPDDYKRLFDRYEKVELKQNAAALDQLREIASARKRVAITCFEADACMCHRGRVAQALSCHAEWNHPIKHI
jgi:uncharacterized protein (DUF488 family)